MGIIQYKIRSKKNPIDKSVKFYAQQQTYSRIKGEQIVEYAVQNSNVDRAIIQTVMQGLTDATYMLLCNGHGVQFWPLGSFRLSLRSLGTETPEQFNSHLLRPHIVFIPSPHLKKAFAVKVNSFRSEGVAFENVEEG